MPLSTLFNSAHCSKIIFTNLIVFQTCERHHNVTQRCTEVAVPMIVYTFNMVYFLRRSSHAQESSKNNMINSVHAIVQVAVVHFIRIPSPSLFHRKDRRYTVIRVRSPGGSDLVVSGGEAVEG